MVLMLSQADWPRKKSPKDMCWRPCIALQDIKIYTMHSGSFGRGAGYQKFGDIFRQTGLPEFQS